MTNENQEEAMETKYAVQESTGKSVSGRWVLMVLGGGVAEWFFKSNVYGMPDKEQKEIIETKYAAQGSTGKSVTVKWVVMVFGVALL